MLTEKLAPPIALCPVGHGTHGAAPPQEIGHAPREASTTSPMPHGRRATGIAIIYGVACHIAFLTAVAAMIVVPFGGMTQAFGHVPAPWSAVCNALLLLQFPLLHTALLSRRGNALLQRLAPPGLGKPLVSTTYALIASLQTAGLFLAWTPSRHILWQAHGPALVVFGICYAGSWVLLAKAVTDAGFALQTGLLGWSAVARGRAPVYPAMPTRGLFAWCRQPIYLAFALTMWTTPTITPDGLIISSILTAYCLVGPLFKEARFARRFGAPFTAYRAETPYWVPLPPRLRQIMGWGRGAQKEGGSAILR